MITQLFNTALKSVLPYHCLVCNTLSDLDKDICKACWLSLPWMLSSCKQCGRGLDIAHTGPLYCGECLKNPPAYDNTITPLIYQDSVISLITKLKFYSNFAAARLFAEFLAERVLTRYSPCELPSLLIPVPLHPKRLFRRGYNQASLVAKHLSKLTNIPFNPSFCHRVRHTLPQSKTSANSRRANMTEAFQMLKPCQATHIAIIDDVMTTGATVGTLSQLLKGHGVQAVSVWCVARA